MPTFKEWFTSEALPMILAAPHWWSEIYFPCLIGFFN